MRKPFDLKEFCGRYYDDQEVYAVFSTLFDYLKDKRGQLVELVDGDRVVFDGFVVTDHEELALLIRRSPEVLVSEKLHYSHLKEHKRLWEIERSFREAGRMSVDDAEYEMDVVNAHLVYDSACPHCGCTEPLISGDDVYFGYCGPAVCSSCKTEAKDA